MEIPWEKFKGKLVSCKLCGDPHELRLSVKGKPFMLCKSWWTNIWANTREAKEYVLSNLVEEVPGLSEVREALVSVEARPHEETKPEVKDPWEMPVEWE